MNAEWKSTILNFPPKILLWTWAVFIEEFLQFSESFIHLLITYNIYIPSVKITEGQQWVQHCPGCWEMKMSLHSWGLFHGVNYSGLLQSNTPSATISLIIVFCLHSIAKSWLLTFVLCESIISTEQWRNDLRWGEQAGRVCHLPHSSLIANRTPRWTAWLCIMSK